MKNFIAKLMGDTDERKIKKILPLVKQINNLEEKYKKLSDSDLKSQTELFKKELQDGKSLDDILPDAFAVVREASSRVLGMRPFDVQLIGGIVLHQGKIGEMKTGEGKTLAATLPAYLNALTGKGVHVVTVNDYLAKRDGIQMAELFEFLGLTTKYIIHGQNPAERKACYEADIVYATNNELGFDYLRDNMATSLERTVQRGLNYVIIDEVDSILIDEARTPLIISAPAADSTTKYKKYAQLIPQLKRDSHYTIDEKTRSALITDEGVSRMEELLGMTNIYTEAGFSEVHHIEQALKANVLFKKDIDYVVKEGEILIVDEFTGRLMPGRRYSDGLHQAIEAKENVNVNKESKTLASITFQNYFRMYDKISGMTGTAETEAEEFYQIYGTDTIVIPTNRPLIRDDKTDNIYKTVHGKLLALSKIVKEKQIVGQPVLIGTTSIDASELISKYFTKSQIPHQVLNAKQHDKEAEIVTNAGQKGAVTIATNMAGRGTDIKLGEGAFEAGGLCVIGSERHESRRIDNQLRGRSGRQGDPGETQFFVSMEDDLMRLFGGEKIGRIMGAMSLPEDMPINNSMISNSIRAAQKKIEGMNFDTRKHVLEYDDVLNKQRTAIYKRRREILESEAVSEKVLELINIESESIVDGNQSEEQKSFDIEKIQSITKQMTRQDINLDEKMKRDALLENVQKHFTSIYQSQRESAPSEELFEKVEKGVFLRAVDKLWMEHIDAMTNLRQDVSLYGYGQRNPLVEYKKEGYYMYNQLLSNIQTGVLQTLFHIEFEKVQEIKQDAIQKTQTNNEEIEGNLNQSRARRQNNAKQRMVAELPNRNDPCPCGSGKKYKKCHGM